MTKKIEVSVSIEEVLLTVKILVQISTYYQGYSQLWFGRYNDTDFQRDISLYIKRVHK
jgi:hypothetical protein